MQRDNLRLQNAKSGKAVKNNRYFYYGRIAEYITNYFYDGLESHILVPLKQKAVSAKKVSFRLVLNTYSVADNYIQLVIIMT